jgi:hypothetical protein
VACDRSVDFFRYPVSSTNKTDRHDIAEILLKVALNTITLNQLFYGIVGFNGHSNYCVCVLVNLLCDDLWNKLSIKREVRKHTLTSSYGFVYLFWLFAFSLGVLDKTLYDKVCQWLATSPPVSPSNKTYRHDITEILLKVALNTIKRTNNSTNGSTLKKRYI